MRDRSRPIRTPVWREDSSRSDLRRLAQAIQRKRRKTFHRVFRLALSGTPPPNRPCWDLMETQRIAILQR